MSLKLIVKSKATCEPNELILSEGSYGIGRMHDNALSIQHDGMSGYHAEFTQTPEGDFTINDLHSTNGTFLNGEQISSPAVVRPGDTLNFGNIEVAVEQHSVSVLESESDPDESSLVLVSLKERIPFEGEDSHSNNTYPITPVRASQPARQTMPTSPPSVEAEALAPESITAIEGIELAREDESTEVVNREREIEKTRQIERERELEQARQVERERELEQARQAEREKKIEQAQQIEREKEIERAREIERSQETERVTISQLQKQIAEFRSAFEQLETVKQTLMQSNLELKQQVEAARVAIQRSAENEAKLRQNYATVVERWKRAESRSAETAGQAGEAGSRLPESERPVLMRRIPSNGQNLNRNATPHSRPVPQNEGGPPQALRRVDPTPGVAEKGNREIGMSS